MITEDAKAVLAKFTPAVGKFCLVLTTILCFSGCAHVTNFYEANVDGAHATTIMGCYGPSSYATFESGSGVTILANEYSNNADEVKVRIEVYSKTGAKFSFSSEFVTVNSDDFKEAISIKMEDFTADYHAGFVASPTADLVIAENRRFATNIKFPAKSNEFYLQLPDAWSNGASVHFPRIHFKNAIKAYIGFCEA